METTTSTSSKWPKILGVIAVIIAVIIGLAFYATSGIVKVAEDQLAFLKAGEVQKAYDLTSKDFQGATSFDQFKAFVEQYPSLSKNKDHTFSSREIVNDQGSIVGSLTSEDGAVTPIEYKFIKEGGVWKILGLNLGQTGAVVENKPVVEKPVEGGKLLEVRLGAAVGKDGIVEANSSEFATDTKEINVSALILGAKKGLKVSAELTHVASGEKVGPATNDTAQDGDIASNFVFTMPTAGWPEGDYKIIVTMSNGEKQDAPFKIAAKK